MTADRIELVANRPARSVTLRAPASLDHFVLHSPARADPFCAEPVSPCTDWLNLRALHSAEALGGTGLEPGQTLGTQFSLLPDWA